MNTTTKSNANSQKSSQGPKQGTEIDEALGQTEFGSWIAENKTGVLAAVAVLILGIFGYGIFNHFQTKKHNKYASELYSVVENRLTQYREGKIKADALVASFNEDWQEMGSFEGAGPYLIQVVDALMEKKDYEPAYKLVSEASERINNPQLNYFINIRAATLAEDLGQKEKAIEYLRSIVSGGAKYLEGKVYLDLGRLYLATGDKENAKASFQWVLDEGKEAEFKKMARLYLEEI